MCGCLVHHPLASHLFTSTLTLPKVTNYTYPRTSLPYPSTLPPSLTSLPYLSTLPPLLTSLPYLPPLPPSLPPLLLFRKRDGR